jgi:16S rRNA (cytosine967-C5)-methyltransferase
MSVSAAHTAGIDARLAAVTALTAIDDGAWSTVAVNRAVAGLADARDRRFASHLVYETVRWQGSIDAALSHVSVRPLAQIEASLLPVLRLGAAQLLVSRVPARAAVDTSVTLAKRQVPRARQQAAGGFVNGILRAIARNGPGFDWLVVNDADVTTRLRITTGHPAWIVDAVRARFGDSEAEAFLHANNEAPGVTLRAIGDRDVIIAALVDRGIDCVAGTHEKAIRTSQFDPSRDPLIEAGKVVVQDEASMRVVDALEVNDGHHILDLCAGPGGKALDIAERAGPNGQVVAVELHPKRAEMIRRQATRLGFAVDVRVGDATKPPLAPNELFDRVLVDAPCSGLGTGRRRPEVRWRKTPDDVRQLALLQHELLAAAWQHTKPGGRLTYAVCTYTAEETDAIRDAFTTTHPDAVLIGSTQLLPHTDDTDGMYFASWQRSEST